MKIFHILNGFCWWDATPVVKSIEEAKARFAPDMYFVESPDFVFEGWGYDPSKEGDARFVRPETQKGFEYDAKTGTISRKSETSDTETLKQEIEQIKKSLSEAENRLAELTAKEEKK